MADDKPVEVELKLAATAEAMETLLASPLLREHARSTVRSRQLATTYYDTADHRLSRRGLAFRVRHSGKKYIQTLKTASAGSGAEVSRGEWEVELADGTPQLTAFEDPAVLDLTGLVLPDELQPAFETRFKRQAVLVEWPDAEGLPAQIEVAFDRGAIRAGGQELPISEVELELKRGQARTLFELARSLRALAPLRLQPLEKAARGYGLALGTPPGWHKAAPVALDAGMQAEDGLQLILGGCVRHWLQNEAATVDGHDAEGLHQLRVALRRLRSALSLFQGMLDPQARAEWSNELRWLLGPLGPARDLDVFTTETLVPVRTARVGDDALDTLAEIAADRRWRAHQGVRETLASQRYADLAFNLACWVAGRGWRQRADVDILLAQRQPIRDVAAAILDKRHRQVRKRGRAFASLGAEARHELRIALKKLRYGTEFFASLYPERETERFRRAAARMQDILGHLNDVAVAEHVVRDLLDGLEPGARQRAAALGAGQVLGWYARQSQDLEPQAIAAWDEFRRLEPFWNGEG